MSSIGMLTWEMQPMSTAPLNRTWVILFGDSGYTGTPYRCEVCRYDPEYRPLNPWQNHANNAFSDGGEQPIGWLPLPLDKPATDD